MSTVPTLAALWPDDALEQVRLVIFGGEACPPELAARIASRDREVWNTYGPTEATVVACGSLLDGSQPIRIGLPLDGWDLAVVDGAGQRVEPGGVGELVIGGVGLGRYLDPAKDAEKYAPFPELGWERAYRSGDLVRYDPEGLVFQGRADDQVKLGGRRIELGEIDAALQALDDVAGGAAVVQRTPAGNQVLVGYVAPVAGATVDVAAANARLRQELPAALVPLVAVVDSLPTRTSGKVDRAALPWPLPGATDAAMLPDTVAWIAERWAAILGVPVSSVDDDFFAHGGGSLTAAQLVSAIRERFPTTTVADVYDHPRIGALAAALDESGPVAAASRDVTPVPPTTGLAMTLLGLPVQVLRGLRVLTWTALVAAVLHATTLPFLPVLPWPALVVALLVFVTPIGKMALTVVLARLLLVGVRPGDHPGVARCTCGSGWRSGSPRRSTVPRPPGRRGSATTPVRSGRGSARTSTCTRSRRSLGCSRSASVRRSSPRWTSRGTGWTVTCSGSAGSVSTTTPSCTAAPRCCPVRTWARVPRSRPARPSPAGCPPVSAGRVRPPNASGRPGTAGRPVPRRVDAGCWRTGPAPWPWPGCR
ncbi:non-ribosomal peptide synthetase [Sphingomonas sp. LR61]|uniref:non-ribosomal peptide synthetase n=1 Tax=Sphingomonas sp. LR61 TaxID=3050234 RepID=UPI003FA6D03D